MRTQAKCHSGGVTGYRPIMLIIISAANGSEVASAPFAASRFRPMVGLADRQAGRFQEASGAALPTGRRRISRRASSPPPVGPFPKDLLRRIRPTRPEPDNPRAEPEAPLKSTNYSATSPGQSTVRIDQPRYRRLSRGSVLPTPRWRWRWRALWFPPSPDRRFDLMAAAQNGGKRGQSVQWSALGFA